MIEDARELARVASGNTGAGAVARVIFTNDSFAILALTRLRESARRWHIPLANTFFRRAQTIFFGIEIGKEVSLGAGVWFVHPVGVVVGGTAKIGARVKFMGGNTVGTASDNGCPVIEDDVVIGCGARVLGPIRVGKGAVIGANAVVIHDVPNGATVVGIPARVKDSR